MFESVAYQQGCAQTDSFWAVGADTCMYVLNKHLDDGWSMAAVSTHFQHLDAARNEKGNDRLDFS